MRWTRGESDENVEDRRDEGGGGGGGFSGGGMRLGIGGIIVLGLLSLVFRKNFFALLDTSAGPGPSSSTSERRSAPSAPSAPGASRGKADERKEFVTFVLNDTQRTWTRLLPESGRQYTDAKLVLFRDSISSACGFAQAASGPFYCPGDRKVYIDLGFYDDLKNRFGAPGEFAQAYVIAHEIGHHVQNLLGIEAKVREQQERHPDRVNALSVRLELQADCLAGVWGYSTQQRGILEKGDVESGLNAASQIGDDRLQKMGRGRVSPESFTHGTSRQRVEWFRKGFDSGSPGACDTFRVPRI